MWVAIILIMVIASAISVICFILAFIAGKNEKKRLISENKMIDRENYRYYKQAHFFDTNVSSLEAVGSAIDKGILHSESISFEPDYANGYIAFYNRISYGTFGAALRYFGYDENSGKFKYRFQVETWKEDKHVSRQDMFGANVLLTQIEKAFFKLDNSTTVIRKEAMYKVGK